MAESLKNKAIFGMLWSALERFGTMGLAFISNLILARLLDPSDYGCVGMIHIFIAIAGVFVYSGLGSALVQKKNPTHIDYSTVFYWNVAVSIVCYAIIFFISPAVARFYELPQLCKVLRVNGLLLFIVAFSIVQSSQLRHELRFKSLSIRTMISSTMGLAVGIVLAYMGYGVWSLVFNTLVSNLVSTILLWRISTWRPTWEFSWASFKELFGFGGMMLLTSLVDKIYVNIQGLIIGKCYSAGDLGYYTQAKKLEEVPNETLSHIVSKVSFPVFSKLQDDTAKLLIGLRKNIKSITFINFPLCMLLIIIAKPLITLLYSAKWEASIPYFQILCISGMIYTMNSLNANVVISLGKGTLYFMLHFLQKGIGIILILLGIKLGVTGLLWAVVLSQYVTFIIYSIANHKLVNYGFVSQFKDVAGSLLLALATGVIVYFATLRIGISQYIVMLIQIVAYIVIYLTGANLFKMEGLDTYMSVLRNMIPKKLRKR